MTMLTPRISRTLSSVLKQQQQRRLLSETSLLRYAPTASAVPKPRSPPTAPQPKPVAPPKPYQAPIHPPLKPQTKSAIKLKPIPQSPSPEPESAPLSKVNGPSTTLPAPLAVPTREPTQSLFSYLFGIGKAYMTFYKTGGRNVITNFKASRDVQDLVDRSHKAVLADAVRANALTRQDFQLLIRSRHDIKRVPAFGLMILVCGELTPLLVVVFSNIVPWTCRIPKQVAGDRQSLEKRRSISFRNLTMAPPTAAGVQDLKRMQLIHISWSLGLSSSVWDWLGGQHPGLPTSILRRKVAKRVEYLDLDDALIERCGGVGAMVDEEVRMACVERGINVLGRPVTDLKGDLTAWLKSRKEVPYEHLLLTRPSVWPVRRKNSDEKPAR